MTDQHNETVTKIMVNGTEVETTCTFLEELIESYGLNKEHVVAEVDGDIVRRHDWADVRIERGTKIELVHFVGGGC
jgi:thiamine biosynthesis protein ThiS